VTSVLNDVHWAATSQ